MFKEDNSDKESDCDKSVIDSPNFTHKSLSSTDNQNPKALALRVAHSFTGVVEELRMCVNFQRINLCNRIDLTTPPKIATVCPCGCLLRPAVTGAFRTREQTSLALHVVSPEVLCHHGYCFEPNQIAMFWKKDCRMFLWKGKNKPKNVIVADPCRN